MAAFTTPALAPIKLQRDLRPQSFGQFRSPLAPTPQATRQRRFGASDGNLGLMWPMNEHRWGLDMHKAMIVRAFQKMFKLEEEPRQLQLQDRPPTAEELEEQRLYQEARLAAAARAAAEARLRAAAHVGQPPVWARPSASAVDNIDSAVPALLATDVNGRHVVVVDNSRSSGFHPTNAFDVEAPAVERRARASSEEPAPRWSLPWWGPSSAKGEPQGPSAAQAAAASSSGPTVPQQQRHPPQRAARSASPARSATAGRRARAPRGPSPAARGRAARVGVPPSGTSEGVQRPGRAGFRIFDATESAPEATPVEPPRGWARWNPFARAQKQREQRQEEDEVQEARARARAAAARVEAAVAEEAARRAAAAAAAREAPRARARVYATAAEMRAAAARAQRAAAAAAEARERARRHVGAAPAWARASRSTNDNLDFEAWLDVEAPFEAEGGTGAREEVFLEKEVEAASPVLAMARPWLDALLPATQPYVPPVVARDVEVLPPLARELPSAHSPGPIEARAAWRDGDGGEWPLIDGAVPLAPQQPAAGRSSSRAVWLRRDPVPRARASV